MLANCSYLARAKKASGFTVKLTTGKKGFGAI
jgi:hypothetical protein